MNTRIKRAAGVVLALAAAFVAGVWTLRWTFNTYGTASVFKEDYERFTSIQVGMTEEEVRARLGEPTYTYAKSSAPKDYYVKGYSFKKRDITNKVLIYVGREPIAYYYFDDNKKVEEVIVGGS